jgi:tetratricopeptide (TPR) repeat protein
MTSDVRDILRTLVAQGLIRPLGEPSEPEYQFRHALTQQAAYASLTRRVRREFHRAVGESLQALFPGQLAELTDVLARHFAHAGDPEPAVRYALQAAERAVATYAYPEAIGHLQLALDVVGPQCPTALHRALLEALGDIEALLHQGVNAIGLYRRALDLGGTDRPDDLAAALRLHRKVVATSAEMKWAIEKGDFERLRQASETSQRSLHDGLRLLEGQPPHLETVRLLTVLSTSAWRMRTPPDWEGALQHAEQAVRAARAVNDPSAHAAALGALSTALFAHGRLRESLQAALERLQLADTPGVDIRERLDSLRGAGSAWMYVGEYEKALPILLEAHAIAVRILASDQHFNVLTLLTQCWFRLDRWEDMLAREAEWEEVEQRYSQQQTGPVCFPLALRAAVHVRRGDSSLGRSLRERSMGIMIRTWGSSHWLRNAHY